MSCNSYGCHVSEWNWHASFDNAITRAQEKLNAAIRELVRTKQLESHKVESYKEEHPVSLDTVFRDIYTEKDDYAELLNLLKFALLITPSIANVERGFSVLSLLVIKQRNSLSP